MTPIIFAVAAALGWITLVINYAAVLGGPFAANGALRATVIFFSFFTILSNLAVALALSAAALPGVAVLAFFRRPLVQTAIASYILVVMLVYYLVLAALWQPQGLALVGNVLAHYVMPILYIGLWLVVMPKQRLEFMRAARFLVFPLAYCGWTLLHGALTGHFPYPFMDANVLGYARVLVNSCVLSAGFLVIASGFIAISRTLATMQAGQTP